MNNTGKFIGKWKKIAIAVIAVMLATTTFCFADSGVGELTATARVNSKGGAYLRKAASATSKQVKLLKNNAKIVIKKEVFTSKTKSKSTNKWYYIKTTKGKKGYIRSDLVDNIKYKTVKAQATDNLNYRFGAGTGMKIKSSFAKYDLMNVVLKAYPKKSRELWYKIKKGNRYYYVCASFVTTDIREKPTEEQLLEEELARVKKIKSINDMALALAWPYGTEASKYSFSKGNPTPIYKAVLETWDSRSKSSNYKGRITGASCDIYAGCVIWAATGDEAYPNGSGFNSTQQAGYMKNNPQTWQKVEYTGDTSLLKAGDIVTYSHNKDGSSAHILIMVKVNGQLAIAEAALNSSYPHINTDLSKISGDKYKGYAKKAVYRLVK